MSKRMWCLFVAGVVVLTMVPGLYIALLATVLVVLGWALVDRSWDRMLFEGERDG